MVSEQLGRCWSVLEWCWNGMEDDGVAWNSVGVVLEWLGMVLEEFIVPLFECFDGP